MDHRGAAGPALAILIAEDELLLALEIEDVVRSIGCTVVGPAAGASIRTTPTPSSYASHSAPRKSRAACPGCCRER
jgi:hypothetical protein